MGWQLSLYTFPLFFAGLLGAVIAALVWRNRPKAGAAMLGLDLAGNALWAVGQGFAVSTTTVVEVLAWTTVTLVGIAIVTPTWLLFALQYTGYEERVGRPTLVAIVLPAVVFVALTVVNPDDLVYVDPRLTDSGVQFGWGAAKWAFSGYAYFVGTLGNGLLLAKVVRSRNVYRKRTFVLFAGGTSVMTGHAIAMAGVSPTPWLTLSPLLYLGFGVVTLLVILSDRFLRLVPVDRVLGLLGSRFQNIAPIARDLVIEKMGSGVLVLDEDNRIVDCNPVARRMLGTGDRRIIGRRIGDIVDPDAFLDDDLEFLDPDVRTGSYDAVWVVGPNGTRRCYDIVITNLAERRDDVSGRVAIVHDVTEQQERKRQLQNRKAQLERQNEQLEEFASVVSHDLRNPLNVAQGRLELAQQRGSLDGLDEVREAQDRMESIIDEMLTLARDGQTVDETAPLALDVIAREAWDTVETGDATLVVDADGERIHADDARMTRVFENLYRNAVEHSSANRDSNGHASDGLTVRVGGLDDPTRSGFYVEDDGPGIPEEQRDDVLGHGFSTADDGTGFGLSIVKSIVEAHGGTIEVTESTTGGARFEIRLPGRDSRVDVAHAED